MYIYRDPAEAPIEFAGRDDVIRGWCFVVEDVTEEGTFSPVWDTWEETFERISRYPADYHDGPIEWRERKTGVVVDIEQLKKVFR